jgi:hypothetical protein
VAWGIQSGGVSSSSGFNLSLYVESRATPVISASYNNKLEKDATEARVRARVRPCGI